MLCIILYLLKCSHIFIYATLNFVLFTVFHMWVSLYLFLTMFHVWTNYVFLHYVFTCESLCCYSLTVFSHVKSLYFIVLISAVLTHSISHMNTSLFHIWMHWVNLLLLFSLYFTIFIQVWTHLVSHVRKLTVLRLHLFSHVKQWTTFTTLVSSLNSHVWILLKWCKVNYGNKRGGSNFD
jgi:hypothetical protein